MRNIKNVSHLIFVMLVLLLAVNPLYGKIHPFIFDHLGVEDGLSETNVKKIIEDKNGFLWIGTQSGLNRYDGYEFKVYHKIPGDTTSLVHNNITDLFIDSKNRFWVGTSEGLNIYNEKKQQFKHLDIKDYNILTITECSKNIIWIGTSGGLYKFHDNTLTKVPLRLYNSAYTSIYAIREVMPGKLLLGSSGKYMLLFNTETESITKNIVYPNNLMPGTNNASVKNILIDSEGKIRVSIFGGGIYTLDTLTYTLKPFCNSLINSYKVSTIMEYEPGVYLIGTDDNGINIYNKNNNTIDYLYEETSNPKSLSSNKISHIFTSSTGQLFICSTISDINVYSKNKYKFELYRSEVCNKNSLPHNSVLCFCEMDDKCVWIGTEQGGVSKFSPKTKNFTRFNLPEVFDSDLKSQTILSIFQDSKKNTWIGE